MQFSPSEPIAMKSLHDPRVYALFRAIGERHAPEVFHCWQAREFPQELWDDLAAEGLLGAATSRGSGLEGRDG